MHFHKVGSQCLIDNHKSQITHQSLLIPFHQEHEPFCTHRLLGFISLASLREFSGSLLIAQAANSIRSFQHIGQLLNVMQSLHLMVAFTHYMHIITSSLIVIKLMIYFHTYIQSSNIKHQLRKLHFQQSSMNINITIHIKQHKKECFQNTILSFRKPLTKLSFLPSLNV